MTNMFSGNSNPNGYDTRYFTSYYNNLNDEFKNQKSSLVNSDTINTEAIKETLAMLENSQLESPDNSELFLPEKDDDYIEELDDISLLKVNYIVEVIKRKLNILHRITRNRVLKKKRISDSVIIEREIEKRATLLITDMLILLKIVDKDKKMETQQKVILLSEINRKSKLTADEKIAIVKRLIAMDIVEDTPSKKHLKNKLVLLFIVKETGFSIDVSKAKGYKPVMQSAEEETVSSIDNNENTTASENIEKAEANTDNNECDKEPENDVDKKGFDSTENAIFTDDSKLAEELMNSIKAPTITKVFVRSKRHFKFGAGFIAKNKTLSILLPSGYTLDDSNRAYQINQPYMCNEADNCNLYIKSSPLYIEFIKHRKTADYTLLDFFNSNIIECRADNLRYRQTLISKAPAVLKHQPSKNIYKASIFIENLNCVYDVQFNFKKTVANKASTVNRILASIKFEGM